VTTACDDDYVLLSGVDFYYNGEHYDSIVWSTNGFIQAGWDEPAAAPANQDMPDSQPPNNVIAPLWANIDLDGGDGVGGGIWYVAILGDGSNFYTIFEWEKAELKEDPSSEFTFQIWILNGSDQIWFVYDELSGLSPKVNATVGIEDASGSSGYTHYYNGGGSPPGRNVDLKVGATSTRFYGFSLRAEGMDGDQILNQAFLSNNLDDQVWLAWANTLIEWPKTYLPIVSKD
jgi:hypothetical protein